ncbi:outer membrane protein assembly factor BamD [Candidatus Chrysopegis kryptomonas]|uniref:Outer membrane protein assembly factor BamD n=1 Tax=Candidatus Chryseopegocella kryptomonas TaxID=1633643 RepID=A0A0P1MPE6_9BACT|nr:outer membrane protein assembly factor BamD [Candidatus Chrysopegis kryptomonas]CUS97065.1 outer membrane protein assembly factor BamD [Candidatus Chrysopegis kryptomonas]
MTSKFKVLLTALIPLIFVLWGCSSSKEVANLSAEDRFEIGKDKFDKKKYLDAIEDFKFILLQYPGSGVADDAQFYLAECYYNRGEYLLASSEYENLIRNYPSSEYVPVSRYKLGLCYYNLSPKSQLDQTYTLKAIDALQAFIEYHPTNELVPDAEKKIHELINKLAKRDYETGLFYMRREFYKAAMIYFDSVIERYPDSDYLELAYAGKIECLMKREDYKEAIRIAEEFERKFPSSGLVEKVRKIKEEALSYVGKELRTGR